MPYQNFLEVTSGNPDLYGPFWIPTTIVFALFMTSTVQDIFDSKKAQMDKLIMASSITYAYAFGVPIILWLVTKYMSIPIKLLELISLYGYGFAVWLPVAVR